MRNEYSVQLDRNGYAPSIVQSDAGEKCAICFANGASDPLNRHEVFYGAYREKSKRLGLWVTLCHNRCHQNGRNSVHQNADVDRALKVYAQRAAMEHYGWSKEDFIREFGKNYLDD